MMPLPGARHRTTDWAPFFRQCRIVGIASSSTALEMERKGTPRTVNRRQGESGIQGCVSALLKHVLHRGHLHEE